MSDAATLVTVTIGDKTFRCSRRTRAHLLWTISRLAKVSPTARLRVIQGAYNTGVDASAGTHDFDAVLDVEIVGMDWWAAQRFLRECGWAAWVRQPPAFSWHIHMASIGYPGRVGVYVPGQIADYYGHRTGLKGHAADPTWFPPSITSTIFNYDAWLKENDMNAAQEKKLTDLADEVTELAGSLKDVAGDVKVIKTSLKQFRATERANDLRVFRTMSAQGKSDDEILRALAKLAD